MLVSRTMRKRLIRQKEFLRSNKENKKDEWANSPAGSSDEQKSFGSPFDKKGNDLHKSKDTFPKVAGGDNPMQKDKFRESIRAELQKRLNEAKGSK